MAESSREPTEARPCGNCLELTVYTERVSGYDCCESCADLAYLPPYLR